MRRWSGETSLYQKANMRIGETAISAEFLMEKKFKNLPIFGI